jgi:hypothetical protein
MSGGSIDWLMLDSSRRPIPLPQERILLTAEGTEATVTIPDQPPQNNSVSGSGGSRKLKEAGTTYITNQRVSEIPCNLCSCNLTTTASLCAHSYSSSALLQRSSTSHPDHSILSPSLIFRSYRPPLFNPILLPTTSPYLFTLLMAEACPTTR